MQLSLYLCTLICKFLAITVLALHLPLNDLTLSLSNLTLPASLTADFNVHCVSIINPPQPGLNPTNCDRAVGPICSIFDQAHVLHHPVPRNQWIWSEPDIFEGCSLGWYVPGLLHAPSFEECSEAFQAINDKCARNSRFNAGNINIRTLPNLFSDGTAVNPAAMRYLMAPQQLTRWREAEKLPFPDPFSCDLRRILRDGRYQRLYRWRLSWCLWSQDPALPSAFLASFELISLWIYHLTIILQWLYDDRAFRTMNTSSHL